MRRGRRSPNLRSFSPKPKTLSAQQRRRLAVEDAPAGAAREREAGEEREEARGRGGADGRDDEHCSARSYETLDNPVMVPSTPEPKTRAGCRIGPLAGGLTPATGPAGPVEAKTLACMFRVFSSGSGLVAPYGPQGRSGHVGGSGVRVSLVPIEM